jgi:hypothetical protein
MKIRILLSLFLSLFVIFSYGESLDFSITIESPKITSTYQAFDIQKLSCNLTDKEANITLEVWGTIDISPQKGYLKEYDVNISDEIGSYVHIFLLSENGTQPVSYVLINRNVKIIDYTVQKSVVEWHLPSEMFENLSGNITIKAYAGIVDLSKNEYVFLDHVMYPKPPPPENEEIYPYWLYIPIVGSVVALLIYVYLRKKK